MKNRFLSRKNKNNNKKNNIDFGYVEYIRNFGLPFVFKSLGLKLTEPRKKIIDFMLEINKPMSADEISKKMVNIDKVTLYRTLDFLEKNKIVVKINLRGSSSLYEINDEHHHHIVCLVCGDVEEFFYCELPNPLVESTKFSFISEHSLEFFGKCKKCV